MGEYYWIFLLLATVAVVSPLQTADELHHLRSKRQIHPIRCTVDSDCHKGQVCQGKWLCGNFPKPGSCLNDADCMDGLLCRIYPDGESSCIPPRPPWEP
ncbi:unnamed protein product, partial [Mesorhabditis spiculigera]